MSIRRNKVPSVELALWAIWLGSLWFLAILVAPGLFKWLPRPEAGLVAGRLFYMMSWYGLAVSAALLMLSAWRLGLASLSKGLAGCLMVVLGISAVELLWLTPTMHTLRQAMSHVSGLELEAARTQFGYMHAVSSVLYAIKMIAGLAWGVGQFTGKKTDM